MAMTQPEADQASFAENYAQMSDAELLKLRSDLASLVEPAAVALQQEISKRRLKEDLEEKDDWDGNDEREEWVGNDDVLSPDFDPSHRPYRWGKFVGSLTTVVGILGAIFSAIQKDPYDVIASILYAMYGVGIYRKKKWAIFILDVGSGVGLLAVILLFIQRNSAEALGGLIIILAFWIPQTIYFWKRRDEMT